MDKPYKYLTEQTVQRLGMLVKNCKKYNENPEKIAFEEREMFSMMFAATFRNFKEFAELGMIYLGFNLSEVQADMSEFMQYGQAKRMIQAQRGQAKSTLAALYCVWRLIIMPNARILVVSGGEKQASDVALLIIRIIMNWSILCWLRPDASKGDRTSASAFDVHYSLKGIDKSASVACVGITANLQGMRADFLLADDIETQRNSMTQTEREKLLLLTKEFAAICISGEIMYLGTPQTKDSVYRSLPQRGYDVRIWTGRYPTNEELERYGIGTAVAPMILNRLLQDPTLQSGGGITGGRGKPTDPDYINEDILQEKELDYGDEGFALQYMLDTTLSDELRTKIKLSDMLVLGCGKESAPERLEYTADPSKLFKDTKLNEALVGSRMYWASGVSDNYIPFEHRLMTLDPSGCGGDELSFAIGAATNSYIYLLSTGGFTGGVTEQNMNAIITLMVQYDLKVLDIEQNMGHGTVALLFTGQIQKLMNWCKTKDGQIDNILDDCGLTYIQMLEKLRGIGVSEYYSIGQKERRIIDTISPITRRHKFVVTAQAIEDDWQYCLRHPAHLRKNFSAFYQLGSITYDRGSLIKDDRADCIQRVVEVLKGYLAVDDEKAAQKRTEQAAAEWIANPMGYTVNQLATMRGGSNKGRKRVYGRYKGGR